MIRAYVSRYFSLYNLVFSVSREELVQRGGMGRRLVENERPKLGSHQK